MAALGRSLNVISLAGIAFAVGMVVDAAIVVLENIYRLRQKGLPVFEAAYEGARQVWGAVFVSALTTVMVFIPILILELEVGQLFRDIAVAISVAVMLSLLVAITVIPALSRRLLGGNTGYRLGITVTRHRPLRTVVCSSDHWFRARSSTLETLVFGCRDCSVRSVGVLHHPVHPKDGLSAGGESELGLWDHAAAARLQPRHDDGHCQIG